MTECYVWISTDKEDNKGARKTESFHSTGPKGRQYQSDGALTIK
jgi:hypothetical protein